MADTAFSPNNQLQKLIKTMSKVLYKILFQVGRIKGAKKSKTQLLP